MPPQVLTATSAPSNSTVNGVLIGLLSSFGSALLIAIVFVVVYIFRYTKPGRIILDRIGRPGEYDDEEAFAREEAEALDLMDEMERIEYLRAKAFVAANPPESVQTDISLSQYLAIQEKGVSAWEFEPELEVANCFVEARTEIEFFDSECTVMSNLPVPKQNEVYYWEAKIFDKSEHTLISIGMATKPYPLFRLPGFHKHSLAYLSSGDRRYNQSFVAIPYGPQVVQGDVVGVGYRPRTGTMFFTRNGKKLEDVVHGVKGPNFFPAVGANGPCVVHVNFGQAGFVFIEANVKKWGLAPMTGSLAPPPPYGSEEGSILLEIGRKDGFSGSTTVPQRSHGRGHSHSAAYPARNQQSSIMAAQQSWSRGGTGRILSPTSPGPATSPTDISLAQLVPTDECGEPSGSGSAATTAAPNPAIRIEVHHDQSALGLGLQDALSPPPDYSSPELSESDSRRNSAEVEGAPLIWRGNTRARRGSSSAASSAAAALLPHPPIPSYADAVQQGAGRPRSGSSRSTHLGS